MAGAVQDVNLVKAGEPAASLTALSGSSAEIARVIIEAAANPQIDAAKISALVGMQEHLQDREAASAFNTAFAAMAGEIPEIDEHGRIAHNGKVQSRYAKFEDIKKVITPILTKHGFALAFETDPHSADELTVIGILTHIGGHERRSRFRSKADTSGSKNAVQGLGSVVTYGKRYTTCDLLNITTREADNDGQGEKPEAPQGFDAFKLAMESAAVTGTATLAEAWKAGTEPMRQYAQSALSGWLAELKKTAKEVGR